MKKMIEIDPATKELGCNYNVPPLVITNDDDGSISIEWIFKDSRLALTIGPKAHEHGWCFVGKEIAASGPIKLRE